MREDSPRWEEINPSPFEHERAGLRELASYLPDTDPYHVWANVEFVATDGSINELDALVLTPSGLIVLELKHWRGEISGDGTQWLHRPPGGRLTPHDNPYLLANRKAKRLAGLIRHYAGRRALPGRAGYVSAAVFLHALRLHAGGLDAIARQHVYGLDDNLSGLPSLKELLLARPAGAINAAQGRQLVDLVRRAKIRPSVANRKVNQLLLHPRPFAEGMGWQDFLAGHSLDRSLTRRVRFYLTSRASEEDLPVIRRAAEREFRLLQGIRHPGIASAVDLVDHAWGPALIFDHNRQAERLDHWLRAHESRLTIAQKLHLVQDLAEIVDYAHSRRLAHRALHPQVVWVTDPGKLRPDLLVTDWQAGSRLPGSHQVTRLTSTDQAGLERFFGDDARRYQAPELVDHADAPGVKLDLFSLGAIAYRIFAGKPPAATAEELVAAVYDGGLNLAAAVDGLPTELVDLIYGATRGDPGERLPNATAFREGLERVWDELTAPEPDSEPEPLVDPLRAQKGDVIEGGLTVVRRLGAGATAVALLVSEQTADGEQEHVLKVARDEQHRERLEAEAQALANLRHPLVAALVRGPVMVGNRTALLLESAGKRTLAEDLGGGRLALGLLERYGRDLLRIVHYLEGQGVWHRDIKPANLAARARPSDREMHLCVFDFSLTSTPADDLSAGTRPYLDPFLGPPRRLRFDAAAERFAAAVTLYEMATGALPRWGEDANPAAVSDEVTLDPALFDPAVTDRLVPFFARALARDAADRFETTEEMEDAWRRIFADLPDSVPAPAEAGPAQIALSRESPLDAAGLTPRARSALERLGVYTVGELLEYEPSKLTRAAGVPDATRKEIRDRVRTLRAVVPVVEPAGEAPDDRQVHGVGALAATLLPRRTSRNAAEHDTMQMLLGQAPAPDGSFLPWPSQSGVARAAGQAQPQVSIWLRKHIDRWRKNRPLAQVRDELVALLDARGGVMSARELAEALMAARGSYALTAQRLPQAIGVVRAAVEAELARGGDSRVAHYRFRSSETVLVGREPDDPTAATTAADLLAYVVRLGRRAAELVDGDPLPTRQRALEQLRGVPAPAQAPAFDDGRLLQLAAEASDAVDLNAQGQLYPVGMPAQRALRLAVGSLSGQRLTPAQVHERVRARFPRAESLPRQPELDVLLLAAEIPLRWDAAGGRYVPPTALGAATSTRFVTSVGPLAGPGAAREVDGKLASVIADAGFLAVLAPLRRLRTARRALLERLGLTELDVTAVLLERLRGLDYPWQDILDADTGDPRDPNFRALVDVVRHEVVPTLRQLLATAEPLLVTEAAPLARYDQLGLLRELADSSVRRPAPRLLLVPARRPDSPTLDGEPLPLTSPATQSIWLHEAWLSGERASREGNATVRKGADRD